MAGIIAGRDTGRPAGTSRPTTALPRGGPGRARRERQGRRRAAARPTCRRSSRPSTGSSQHRNDAGLNIRVLNLSFGTDGVQDYRLDPLAHAVEVAWRKGIVVVVAAGNGGTGHAPDWTTRPTTPTSWRSGRSTPRERRTAATTWCRRSPSAATQRASGRPTSSHPASPSSSLRARARSSTTSSSDGRDRRPLLQGSGTSHRAYASLADRHNSLERLFRFSRDYNVAPESDDVLPSRAEPGPGSLSRRDGGGGALR